MAQAPRVDGLQYCAWDRGIFEDMREGGLGAVHATIAYHEDFRETVREIQAWNRRFREHGDLIRPGRGAEDIRAAQAEGRVAVFFGAQNPQVIENDIGLVEVLHTLGLRFLQVTYNNQSLLGAGWQEPVDGGLTRMGREVVAEMNRLGMIVDLSHAGERTALETVEASARPVCVSHANPRNWRETGRNVSDTLMRELAGGGGLLGFSLYPHHLAGGSDCTLTAFCEMAARTAEVMGADRLAIGSDLCQGQPDSVVEWMRTGRWTHRRDGATFPAQPSWFQSNRDWPNVAKGLRDIGFSDVEADGIMGANWVRYIEEICG